MVASADLGGLGPREGLRVSHVWQPPPPPPPLMVRVANTGKDILFSLFLLLPLFLCPPNRCASAWAIWLPVLVTLAGVAAWAFSLGDGDKDILHALSAFGIGLAATWLLAPYLRSRHRLLVFLKTALVLAAASLLAFLPRLLGEKVSSWDFRVPMAIGLGVVSLVAALALVLAGLSVRRRFGRIQFLLWLAVWTWLAWNLGGAPIALVSSGRVDWEDYFRPLLVAAGITLGFLLPLLLLSFFHPFYRDRFMAFVNASQPQASPKPPAAQSPSS